MTVDLTNKKAIEAYFADHFDTVLFPVLADIYLQDSDLVRARKVCEIGLNHHPQHPEGLFILANVELAEGNLQEAEKHLKVIVEAPQPHYQGAIMLANIQKQLNRSHNTIAKNWKRVLNINSKHPQAIDYLDELGNGEKSSKPDEKEIAEEPKSDKIQPSKIRDADIEPLSVSPQFATFTLVSVLKNQGLYHQALGVLDELEKKGADTASIEFERTAIKDIIKATQAA
ncbi:tetratricopeptide repeat protein [Candidatus Neomarinimicrobiota bacterium]